MLCFARTCASAQQFVKFAQRHGFGEFASNRADNRVYQDEQILNLFASACLTQGSTNIREETRSEKTIYRDERKS